MHQWCGEVPEATRFTTAYAKRFSLDFENLGKSNVLQSAVPLGIVHVGQYGSDLWLERRRVPCVSRTSRSVTASMYG
jgi:hypothetical protein